MGIEYSYIKVISFKPTTPEAICRNIEPSSILNISRKASEHLAEDPAQCEHHAA